MPDLTAYRRLSGTACLLALGAAGCVRYTPVELRAAPPPGAQVRATLTAPAAVRLAGFFGTPIQRLEGELVGSSGDSIALGISRGHYLGVRTSRRDTLFIAPDEVALLEEKHLSTTRTAVAVGASGVVLGAIAIGLFRSAGGSPGDDGGDSDQFRIPLLILSR